MYNLEGFLLCPHSDHGCFPSDSFPVSFLPELLFPFHKAGLIGSNISVICYETPLAIINTVSWQYCQHFRLCCAWQNAQLHSCPPQIFSIPNMCRYCLILSRRQSCPQLRTNFLGLELQINQQSPCMQLSPRFYSQHRLYCLSWYIPVILVLRRGRQEDRKFKVTLVNIVSLKPAHGCGRPYF